MGNTSDATIDKGTAKNKHDTDHGSARDAIVGNIPGTDRESARDATVRKYTRHRSRIWNDAEGWKAVSRRKGATAKSSCTLRTGSTENESNGQQRLYVQELSESGEYTSRQGGKQSRGRRPRIHALDTVAYRQRSGWQENPR